MWMPDCQNKAVRSPYVFDWCCFMLFQWLLVPTQSCPASLTTVASCSAAKVAIAFVVGWSNIKVLGNLRGRGIWQNCMLLPGGKGSSFNNLLSALNSHFFQQNQDLLVVYCDVHLSNEQKIYDISILEGWFVHRRCDFFSHVWWPEGTWATGTKLLMRWMRY